MNGIFAKLRDLSHRLIHSNPEVVSIGFIDLDGFSEINNEHGHAFGDDILEQVVEFGNKFVGADWNFDREYGQGDEFLIQLPGLDKDSALEVMEDFRVELKQLQPKGQEVTASIGVATLPEDGDNEDDIIDKADLAMLNAEQWGGDQVIAYGSEKPSRVVEVKFEEAMLIEQGDLISIEMWMDGSDIRALEIYNRSKGIPNQSSSASTLMTATKYSGEIEGIVKEIIEWDSSKVIFDMRGNKKHLDNADI